MLDRGGCSWFVSALDRPEWIGSIEALALCVPRPVSRRRDHRSSGGYLDVRDGTLSITGPLSPPMRDLVETIAIDADPETVWSVLVDTDAYREWNPSIDYEGALREKCRPRVRLRLPGLPAIHTRPRIVRASNPRP